MRRYSEETSSTLLYWLSEAVIPARISSAHSCDVCRALGRVLRPLGRTGFRQRHGICSVHLRLSDLSRAGCRHARRTRSFEEAIRSAASPLTHEVSERDSRLRYAVSSPASQLPASSNLIHS